MLPIKEAAEGEALTDDDKQTNADNAAANEQTTKDNLVLAEHQKRICCEVLADEARYDEAAEQALVKLCNYREPAPEGAPAADAAAAEGEQPAEEAEAPEETFRPEAIPLKIPMAKCKTETGISVAMYHSEAAYSVRRYLIEHAKKQFPELEKAETNAILTHSHHHHYKQVEERFEDEFLKKYGYNKGGQFSDQNVRITFKTFLEGDE